MGDVLEEASEITAGVRAKAYGSARENAEVFAQMASAATGLEIEPEHFPVLMVCLKLARLRSGGWHRDSWVDVAGYARVAEMIEDDREDLGLDDLMFIPYSKRPLPGETVTAHIARLDREKKQAVQVPDQFPGSAP